MRSKWLMIALAAMVVTGCRFQCSMGNEGSTKGVSTSEGNGPMKGATIKNDIELDAKNVKVKEAYLLDENKNLLTQNEVQEGKNIRCVVVLDTGWTKYDGKSYIGASEKVISGSGDVVLDEPDLFKDYTESGVSAKDAGVLSVLATITRKQPGMDDYKVQFRMWDKKGDGEITGSFKFKVK